MNWFKNYIKEHCTAVLIVFFIWLAALVLGMYFAFAADKKEALDLQTYIDGSVLGKRSFGEIFRNGLLANLKFTAVFLIGSLFLATLPVNVFLLAFKGFSTGFTSALIVRLYALKGLAVTITSIAVPTAFTLPVLCVMFVSGFELPFELFSQRKHILWNEKCRLRLIFAVKTLILFALLCVITLAQAALSPYLWSVLTNKG